MAVFFVDDVALVTDGLVSSTTELDGFTIATIGYISIFLAVIRRGDFPFSGGGKEQKGETRKERLLREDEEMLMIIQKFLETWV